MSSIWQETSSSSHFGSSNKQTGTDVLIIGGGITGVLCAYMLKQAGIDYMLVEENNICSKVTKDTTAKITLQHGLIYNDLINKFGIKTAKLYFEANNNALLAYRKLCKDIDCDFENADSIVYSLNNLQKIENEVLALKRIGADAELLKDSPLPFSVREGVVIKNQAQFHPLKFIYSLAKDLNIRENTKVLKLKPGHAITSEGRIHANRIIVATHFPFINKHGLYFLKMYQHRSYVIALKNAGKIDGMYVDESDSGLSFRNYGDLLIIGGGSHRTGKQGGGWNELEKIAKRYYPGATITHRWATQDCMTLDKIPYIGQYSRSTENLYVATGFNKWGMTSAMVAANILTDLIIGKKNKYVPVFSPSRSIIHPQLIINAGESIAGLLTPTTPRCTHLGCALKYNKAEHSWDCSCHGSRFSDSGKLIDNPATKDKKRPLS